MPTLRSVVFRFEDITAFSVTLREAPGSLPLPETENVIDGEWVLAIFEIGSRKRATAAAARGVRAAGDTHLAFERRDWDRLLAFVAARSEHMRAAKPAAKVSSGRIPVADVPPMDLPPMSEPIPSSALESSRVPFGARVLLVDDDARSRGEVEAMLVEIGLRVEAVASAAEAEERMRDQAFDALVMDFHATGVRPLEFVRELRKHPLLSPLPVLFLSDRASSRDAVEAFASGADDFLAKPFRTPELGARVFGLLRRARLTRPTASGGGRA
jgi:two-component system, OmpR family, phosphate regulon response regulator PhoB